MGAFSSKEETANMRILAITILSSVVVSFAFRPTFVPTTTTTRGIIQQQGAARSPATTPVDYCVKESRSNAISKSTLGRQSTVLKASSNGDEKGSFDKEFLEFGVPPMPLGGEAVYEGYGGEYPNQDAVSCDPNALVSCLDESFDRHHHHHLYSSSSGYHFTGNGILCR